MSLCVPLSLTEMLRAVGVSRCRAATIVTGNDAASVQERHAPQATAVQGFRYKVYENRRKSRHRTTARFEEKIVRMAPAANPAVPTAETRD